MITCNVLMAHSYPTVSSGRRSLSSTFDLNVCRVTWQWDWPPGSVRVCRIAIGYPFHWQVRVKKLKTSMTRVLYYRSSLVLLQLCLCILIACRLAETAARTHIQTHIRTCVRCIISSTQAFCGYKYRDTG